LKKAVPFAISSLTKSTSKRREEPFEPELDYSDMRTPTLKRRSFGESESR